MIDLRYVKKLIDMLDESSVDSIEISSDKGMKIRISKSPSSAAPFRWRADADCSDRPAAPRRCSRHRTAHADGGGEGRNAPTKATMCSR